MSTAPSTGPGGRTARHGSGEAGPRRALVGLCITEITSWGVLYYAFPVIATTVTADTGWSYSAINTAFSAGLLICAAAGVPVGWLLNRHGPRRVMSTGSVLGVGAILAVAAAPTLPWFFAAWILVGLSQSMVLYSPAFAALTRWYGRRRIRALTVLSLVAGLSSTVFAPLTALLVTHLSWRATYVALATVLAVVTVPLHIWTLTPPWRPVPTDRVRHLHNDPRHVIRSRAFLLLVAAMTLAGLGLYAATVNLVPLFVSRGASTTVAATALAACGAGQLLGRLGYPALTRRTTPERRAAVILAASAATVAALAIIPGPIPLLIAAAIGAGALRGTYTLLQATAVSDRWGTSNFATLNAVASAPTTAAIALAPAAGTLLAGKLDSYPTAFALLAASTLAGAALATATGR
jgi:MFS family permease